MANHHHHHQQKHLYELLKDDQEPFVLNNYIADVHRRCHLTRTQPKPPKSNLARNVCFLSLSNSPDPRKSPLYFPKSPAGARVPSKTTSLLLEAAIRVSHKTQGGGGGNKKKKKNSGKIGSGIFGSLLKRLGNSKKPKKEEVNGVDVKVSVKDILRRDLNRGGSGRNNRRAESDSSPSRTNTVSSGGHESEPSSAVWSSESNESIDLDLDLECRSSSSGGAGLSDEELEYVTDVVYRDDAQCFCESLFHFVLERSTSSSSSGRRTPEFSSPAASPVRLKTEGNEDNNDVESLNKCQVVQKQGEEEEKEQCSPVSVLDPPFEDDDDCDEEEEDDHDDEDEREDDDEGFDMECSFAFVQKAKQELFEKLRRFEKLAELDPVELEKRMLEYDDEEYDNNDDEGASECGTPDDNCNNCTNQLVMDELSKSSIQIPAGDVKRLVSDVIDEEEKQGAGATKKVCKRFEARNEVESNTIEMMVEHDFNNSHSEWRHKGGQVSDIAMEIELAIFDLLAEELM